LKFQIEIIYFRQVIMSLTAFFKETELIFEQFFLWSYVLESVKNCIRHVDVIFLDVREVVSTENSQESR